jgi:hypothetical protein
MNWRANYEREPRSTSWIETAVVAVIAAATNFLYFALANNDYFFPDSFTYLEPARNLIRGLGFTNANGLIETLRTPGYPLLLAGFGLRIVPMIAFQHLLNVALAVASSRSPRRSSSPSIRRRCITRTRS